MRHYTQKPKLSNAEMPMNLRIFSIEWADFIELPIIWEISELSWKEVGFEDCLVESGIYSNAVISKINRGKAYNRGMRAHKLLFEALSRLKWKAFIDWIEENNVNVDDIDEEQVKNAVTAVQNLMKDAFNNKDVFRTAFEHLKATLCPVTQLLERFERNSRNRSDTYVFWDNYLEMVQLLLEYVASEREGDIKSHINAFADMLSYDFACNHLNYARWGSVYIAEMHQLEETHPDVFAEFLDGKHKISRSTQESRYFSRVWSDMAIEQSINRDCGTLGGLTGLKTNVSAMERWFLTAHLKANVVTATKAMLGIGVDHPAIPHKESTVSRTEKDEICIENIIDVVEKRMFNPFIVESEWDSESRKPLVNIATGLVAPPEVWLNGCKQSGSIKLKDFLNKRIQTQTEDLFDPITTTN